MLFLTDLPYYMGVLSLHKQRKKIGALGRLYNLYEIFILKKEKLLKVLSLAAASFSPMFRGKNVGFLART